MRTKRHDRQPSGASRAASPRSASGAFGLLLANFPLPMWVYDQETLRFLEVNDAATAYYGYSRAEFLSMTITDIRPAEDLDRVEASGPEPRSALQYSGTWRHRRADGALLDVELTSQHLLGWEGQPATLVVAHDVTETRRFQAELARRPLHDEATGLANAALFADRTTAATMRARREGGHVGVLVIGLGDLEAIAATAGDERVEAMVYETARRLQGCCDEQMTLARLGGGRFAILCETEDEPAILRHGTSIAAALATPVTVYGWGELKSSASVGIALADGRSNDATGLLRDASSAMRHAVERGDGQFVLSDAELRKAVLDNFDTEQALAQASRLEQLRLHYQPVVSLANGEVIACEALMRWERPGFGLVASEHFIPIAERSVLIVELGAWAIEQAIAEAATWPGWSRSQPKVAVNITARQLHDEHLVEHFASSCAASGLPPSSVCVELTESVFVATDDSDAYRVLTALRETGIGVAIDDFGTGYSTLSRLKHLPVDVIKIDRSFVTGLGEDRVDSLLVEATVRVAHGLGLQVIAEGVETETQLEELRSLGCDAAQGYLFARPGASKDLPASFETASRVGAERAGSQRELGHHR